MSRGTFSTLQHLLKQAYSTEVAEQQQAVRKNDLQYI